MFTSKIAGVSWLQGVTQGRACRCPCLVPLQKSQKPVAAPGQQPAGPGCEPLGWVWSPARGAGETLVHDRLRTAVTHRS